MMLTNPTPSAPDARSAEILASVRQAFVEKGFDGASMQDLARAAGMSVGNFYRYFPSKSAIVEGMIALDLAEMEGDFAAILGADDPMSALRATIRSRISDAECAGDGQLWAEITAAALRKPDIGAAACRMEDVITGHLTTVFAQVTGLPWDEAHRRFSAHALFVVMLVKAAAMQKPHPGPLQANLSDMILRTIDNTLDTILSAKA